MPGEVIPVNISNLLSLPPKDIPECMSVKVGDKINVEDTLAETKGIFGLFKNSCQSKYAGTVETISEITGQDYIKRSTSSRSSKWLPPWKSYSGFEKTRSCNRGKGVLYTGYLRNRRRNFR